MKAVYTIPEVRAIADLDYSGDNRWTITMINVPSKVRKQGYGSKLLTQIITDADDEDVTLILYPTPSGGTYGGLKYKALVRWYERYGFVMLDSGVMWRYARGNI